jgi:hypothetical protein
MRRLVVLLLISTVLAALLPGAQARSSDAVPNVVVASGKPPGTLKQIGHEPLLNRGMNAALAVHDGFAYVGSRTDGLHPNTGVAIVDVRDPSQPEMVGQIGPPHAAVPGETTRELRVWPQKDLLIVLNLASNCSYLIHVCSPTSAAGADNYRFFDISDPANPEFVAEYVPSKDPHEFVLWVDPRDADRALLFQSSPGAGTEFFVTDISKARKGKFEEIAFFRTAIPNPDTDNRIHSLTITPDGKRAHIAALGGGYFEVDTSQVAAGRKDPKMPLITDMAQRPWWGDPGAHSAVKLPGRDYVLITDEVYGYVPGLLEAHGCPWGWVRIIDVKDHVAPQVVSEFKLAQNTQAFCETEPGEELPLKASGGFVCELPASNDPVRNSTASFASHNPTLTRNLALITWHSGGLQVLDISNPRKPRQAAEFIPEPLPAVTQEDPALSSGQDKVVMWSFPVVADGLIYAVDVRNGLYVLEYSGPHEREISGTRFLEGNSNLR